MSARITWPALVSLSLALTAGTASPAWPQGCGPWEWVNPLPDGLDYRDLLVADGVYVAVGDAGLVATSTDLEAWTDVETGVSESLDGIAWNGSRLVVVGEDGLVLTSDDGTHWLRRPTPTTFDLHAVIWGGGTWVAVGQGGVILTSSDGESWTIRDLSSRADRQLSDVAWNGSRFVAVGGGGTTYTESVLIVTSTDAATWTTVEVAGAYSPWAVTWNGSQWLVVGAYGTVYLSGDGLNWEVVPFDDPDLEWAWLTDVAWVPALGYVAVGDAIAVSPDGRSWTPVDHHGPADLRSVLWDGTRVVAAGDLRTVESSPDGLDWTLESGSEGGSWFLYGATYQSGTYVAVGRRGTVVTSPDGRTWTAGDMGTTLAMYGVGGHDGLLVAVGQHVVYTSPDGITWGQAQLPTPPYPEVIGYLRDVVWTGTDLVVVGDRSILVSSDGVAWELVYSGERYLNGVTWDGERAIAVSSSGGIVTSSDLHTWEWITAPTTRGWPDLYDVASGGGVRVAVGGDGAVLWSDDGRSWHWARSGVDDSLYGVAWTGDRFVAAGRNGHLVASGDGRAWTRLHSPTATILRALAAHEGQVVAVGYDSAILEQSCSAPLRPPVADFSWSPTQAVAGEAIAFADASTGSVGGRRWVFGDGSETTASDPSHRFLDPGSYRVRLSVTNGEGSTIAEKTVDVRPRTDACFTPRWSAPSHPAEDLNGVAAGPDRFVAVGEGGLVLLSGDGETWGPARSPTRESLNGICWGDGRFVAVGERGVTLSSPDGAVWSVGRVPGSPDLRRVVHAGDRYVAVGDDGAIATSPDGGSWEAVPSPIAADLVGLDWSGERVVAPGSFRPPGVNRTDLVLLSSADGINWAFTTFEGRGQPYSVVWTGNEFLVYLEWDALLSSPDGVTWTEETSEHPAPFSVCRSPMGLVAVGHAVGLSPDGRQWELMSSLGLGAVASSSETVVAVGDGGSIAYSRDARAWGVLGGLRSTMNDAVWSGDRFVAVGGHVVSGPETSQPRVHLWRTSTASSLRNTLSAVARRGGRLVAVGAWGRMVVSPDGESWTAVEVPTQRDLTDVVDSGSAWVVVGAYGAVLTSADGGSWTAGVVDGTPHLDQVLWDGGRFVARSGSHLYTSSDGLAWTAEAQLPSGVSWRDLAWGGGLYVAVGRAGTIATSPDASAWQLRESGIFDDFSTVVRAGDRFIAVAGSTSVVSEDGEGWTRFDTALPPGAANLVWSGTQLMALTRYDGPWLSPDGQIWTPADTPVPAELLESLAYDGNRIVADAALVSDDGLTWSRTGVDATDVIWTGERFLAVDDEWIFSSTDGARWTRLELGQGARHYAIAAGDNLHLAVGVSAFRSPDGAAWVRVADPPGILEDLLWDGARFVGVGGRSIYDPDYGTVIGTATGIATTEDGTSWTPVFWGTGPILRAVAFDGEHYVAVGSLDDDAGPRALAFVSDDGLLWERYETGYPVILNGVAAVADGFVAVGDVGVILWSADGREWVGATPVVGTDLEAAIEVGDRLLVAGRGILRLGCEEAASVSEPGAFARVIPATAHLPGTAGTTWRTDAVLHNPSSTPVGASLFLLERGQDNRDAVGVPLVVPEQASLGLDALLPSLFGTSDTSGAVVVGSELPLLVTSRTFNDAPEGTYGQQIAGSPVGAAASGAVPLIQLTHDESFRTNLGLVNRGAVEAEVRVDLYDADGTWFGRRTEHLPPFGTVQDNGIFATVTQGSVADGYAVVSLVTAGARFFAYASVVDNRSGDPIFVTPPAVSAGEPLWVPAAAHLQGANQTRWRTDLEVANLGSAPAAFTLELLLDGSAPPPQTFTLEPGRAARYDDVVAERFGVEGSGVLRVTPDQGSILISSRTYNDGGGLTYGQYIPGLPDGRSFAAGETARLVQLRRSADPDRGFRTNLGVVNVAPLAITVTASLFTADGAALGRVTVDLEPHAFEQLFDVFARVTSGGVELGFAEVSSPTPGARFFAYASVVDNSSGDPVFIVAE